MKTILKTLFIAALFSFLNSHSFAQPAKGIKVGANYTFYKDLNGIDYTANPGFQFGYSWSTKLNKSLALSAEGLYSKKSSHIKYINDNQLVKIDEKRNAGYFSLPLGLHYCFPNAYLGGGYEFGYLISGNLPVNEFNHALFLQAGYKVRFVDFVLKYAGTINQETGGTVAGGGNYQGSGGNAAQPAVTYTPKANTLEFSLIFNLGPK